MEDSSVIISNENPFKNVYSTEIIDFDHGSIFSINDLNPISSVNNTSEISDDCFFNNVIDLFDDPNTLEFLNNSQFSDQDQVNIHQSIDNVILEDYSGFPISGVPFSCSCCQILREIVHTNGNNTKKLEIHGKLGLICHAMLHDQHYSGTKYHMFDFSKKSIGDVKRFLVQYCEEHRRDGYSLVEDPLSVYYKALCVGLEWGEDLNTCDFASNSLLRSGICRPEKERVHRTSLSAQRERTRALSLDDLVDYFHLPIEEAAKKMNVCLTVVKRICRRNGLTRWPHRKIKSLNKRVSTLRDELNNTTKVGEKARIENEIESVQQQILSLCGGIPRR